MRNKKEHSHNENENIHDVSQEQATENPAESDKMTDETATAPAEEECPSWQEKYDELNNSYLRLHADFDNFRKRTVKEKADLIKGGGERVLGDILPLIDDFDRALISIKEAEDKEAFLQGMDLIYTKFVNFLQQHGVKEITAIGEVFDADRFEALTTIPVTDKSQSGKIVDCIQKGYTLNDKILRFPKVIVGE